MTPTKPDRPLEDHEVFAAYRERFGCLDLTWMWLTGPGEWAVGVELLREALRTGVRATDEELFRRLGRISPAEFLRQEHERLGPDWFINI